ncbi:MAG: hypothetical protein Q8L93_12700 [Rhodocyclaceae bacterium]|nr:hypothetical protein [Rhodocyclaceae bacterium]
MTNLQILVGQHQAKAAQMAAQPVDWDKRKSKWLSVLQALIDQIRASLISAGVSAEQIVVTRHGLTEETLGSYQAPGLKAQIGTVTVEFLPIGSVIIGGYGRVDVTGPRGEVKLIAEDAQSFHDPEDKTPSYEREWVWSAYPDKSRRSGFCLDDEGLAKVMELVLGSA